MANKGEHLTELAYAAGFMDGEGSFMIQRQVSRVGTTQHCAKVSATQVRPTPLELLQKLFGGRISPVHSTYGVEYQWSLGGKAAALCAAALQPFLLLKRRHAEILVEFQTLITDGRGGPGKRLPDSVIAERENLRAEIRALNGKRKRGDAERLSGKTTREGGCDSLSLGE